eukprot:gene7175-7746_t
MLRRFYSNASLRRTFYSSSSSLRSRQSRSPPPPPPPPPPGDPPGKSSSVPFRYTINFIAAVASLLGGAAVVHETLKPDTTIPDLTQSSSENN